jgi:carbon-monoxide dehydrogenase medium subunit
VGRALPLLAFRLVYPSKLVDLGKIGELALIEKGSSSLSIGAMVTHVRNLTDPVVRQCFPIIPQVVAHVAHQAVRSRGTLGGSLSHADCAAEMPVLMCALNAVLHIRGSDQIRSIPAVEFFHGHYMTDLAPGEILVRIEIPFSEYHWAFEEVARRHGDFALAMSLAGLRMDAGKCVAARLVIGAAGEVAVISSAAAQFLLGKAVDEDVAAAAAKLATETLAARSDIHGSEELRRHLAETTMKRAILRAAKGE